VKFTASAATAEGGFVNEASTGPGYSAIGETAGTPGEDGHETQPYPALPPSSGNPMQDEALHSLLMAWYYSGYATGRYQAMMEVGAFGATNVGVDEPETERSNSSNGPEVEGETQNGTTEQHTS
jgi:hypothetical protein